MCFIQEGSWTNEMSSDPGFGLWTHVAQFDTVSKDFFLWGGGCSEFALPCTGSWCNSNGLNVRLFVYNPVHLSWRALEHPSESASIGRKRSALELAPGGNHGKSYEPSWMLYAHVQKYCPMDIVSFKLACCRVLVTLPCRWSRDD